jgi:DNA-binding transcriptional regulator YiaG
MRLDDLYVTAMRQAAIKCGGEEELARRLDVAVEELREWTQGVSVPPIGKVFVAFVLSVNCGKPD